MIEMLPQIECAFINKRSGAKNGTLFLQTLNDLDGVKCEVHDLATEDPEELLLKYLEGWAKPYLSSSRGLLMSSSQATEDGGSGVVGSRREDGGGGREAAATPCASGSSVSISSIPVIMACGGDGTFSWIASTALKLAHDVMTSPGRKDRPLRVPYCVIPFPLGTGNDMSGVLGWGRSLDPSPEGARKLMEAVQHASIGPKCDVWGVKFNKFQSMSRFSTMCNYFSIGADAKASKLFENHRTSKPGLYRSQSFNKASYAAFGGFLALKGSSSVGKRIRRLVVDGKEVKVPAKAKALIVLNIPSYADGTKPWDVGKNHPHFKEAAIDDGLVEIFCLKSILSIAFLKTFRGIFSGGVKKLAQGRAVSIEMHPMEEWAKNKSGGTTSPRTNLYAQVDGESFEFDCDQECIDVYRKGSVPVLFGPKRGKALQGPPAKLKSGSFNARWPKSPSEGGLSP